MDTIGSFKEALKRSFLSGENNNNGFYSSLRSGVSEYLEHKRTKGYEFAEKPNYVNPFAVSSPNKKSNTSATSLERDSCPSPVKKESIVRRHTDNYGTKPIVADDFKTHLTP